MKRPLLLLILAATAIAVQPTYAQRKSKVADNLRAGLMLAQPCMACHGSKGNSIASPLPTIGGQNEPYLQNTLRSYRDGVRPGTMMPRLMKGYSDKDIDNIALYFSTQTWTPNPQKFEPELVENGRKSYRKACKDCHLSDGYKTAEGEYPLLAGQWLTYMQWTVAEIISGNHKVDDHFAKKINELTPQEVDNVLHFYASQP